MMMMLRYNEAEVVRTLTELTARSRVAFAAACAERLFPAYEAFCKSAGRGDRTALANILERVWTHLRGDEMEIEQIQLELSRCMSLIPGEDETPWVDEQPYADEAATAVAYTLRALESGEVQEAVWASQRGCDAIDYYLINRVGVEGDSQVPSHPLMQAELARQRRDLDELRGAAQDSAAVFVRLRDRAKMESASFFGLAS